MGSLIIPFSCFHIYFLMANSAAALMGLHEEPQPKGTSHQSRSSWLGFIPLRQLQICLPRAPSALSAGGPQPCSRLLLLQASAVGHKEQELTPTGSRRALVPAGPSNCRRPRGSHLSGETDTARLIRPAFTFNLLIEAGLLGNGEG